VDFRQATATAVIDADRAEKIVVLPDRKILHARINSRFEKMVDTGAVEEVRALLALKLGPAMPVMKAIGVPQIADLLAGRLTRDAMLKQASAATRQYAKRQMTWFRNQMDESWQRVA
jgi:tRNA dimethylallyltransferase